MDAPRDSIPLREYVEKEFAHILKDIDTLNRTIKETAEAHAKSHDRDHEQTAMATDKAERSLTLRLDQIKVESSARDDERKRQIEDVKSEIAKQSNQWSNLNGKGAALAIGISFIVIAGFFLSLWATFSK